jgi:hypothetical protein
MEWPQCSNCALWLLFYTVYALILCRRDSCIGSVCSFVLKSLKIAIYSTETCRKAQIYVRLLMLCAYVIYDWLYSLYYLNSYVLNCLWYISDYICPQNDICPDSTDTCSQLHNILNLWYKIPVKWHNELDLVCTLAAALRTATSENIDRGLRSSDKTRNVN